MMNFPKKLRKGDTVGIICPSSPIATERIGQCVDAINRLGYNVKLADNLDVNYGGYMTGNGKARAKWVNDMFADPEVDAIICARGGEGGSRAMEYVDFELIKQNPKIFVGYSDVTCLHLGITQNCGFVTFHGAMVSANFVDDFDAETEASFFGAVNADADYEYKNPKGFELGVLKSGKATGQLTGGNLSLLSASMGTPYEVDTKDKIIFLEEVSEPVYNIDKWMHQLRFAGKLQECKGILLGQFTDVVNKRCPEYDVNQCVMEALDGIDIPVMYNIQSGHEKPMTTLPLGAMCTMDTEDKTITFQVTR
ncbi:muramoyltetrapeptide carboxypeptidase [Clostridiales Family XIII bacterium PM5-7]